MNFNRQSLRLPRWSDTAEAVRWLQAGRAPLAVPRWVLWPAILAFVGFIVLATAVRLHTTMPADVQLELAIHTHASLYLTAVMYLLTEFGYIPVIGAATAFLCYRLLLDLRRWEAAAAAAVMLGEGALNTILKLAMHRARPSLFTHAATLGLSLPSGHAMATFCLMGLILWFAWANLRPVLRGAVVVVGVTFVIAVGLSRGTSGSTIPVTYWEAGSPAPPGLASLPQRSPGSVLPWCSGLRAWSDRC